MEDRPAFDRSAEDLGNIVELGHVNFRIPDQGLATTFYVTGLGLTRDPAMMTGTSNMWVNVGRSQFHLPTGRAVVAPGIVTGLVLPDLQQLLMRLASVQKALAETTFGFSEAEGVVHVTCPWGNRFACHAPDPARFGGVRLGLAYSEFEIARGRASAIGRFYSEVMGARVTLANGGQGEVAIVTCGDGQSLRFRECDAPAPACPDHHIQIYLADFSGPHRRLMERGIPVRESSRHQYSFAQLRDPGGTDDTFTLDHETRSMTHPMYGRVLINRNAMQGIGCYRAGQDLFEWRL